MLTSGYLSTSAENAVNARPAYTYRPFYVVPCWVVHQNPLAKATTDLKSNYMEALG